MPTGRRFGGSLSRGWRLGSSEAGFFPGLKSRLRRTHARCQIHHELLEVRRRSTPKVSVSKTLTHFGGRGHPGLLGEDCWVNGISFHPSRVREGWGSRALVASVVEVVGDTV